MKQKVCSVAALSLFSLAAFAQLQVETKSFDLESIKKEKWRMYSGFKSADGNLVIKMGNPVCDMSKNNLTGTYTFSGVEWDFEELYFDASLNYLKSSSKHFNTSVEALNYEPVWGKKFGAMPEGWTGGGSDFDSRYIGKKTVLASSTLGGKPTIISGVIFSKVSSPSNAEKIVYACSETPTFRTILKSSPKEEKGEKWMYVKSYHEPGSGIIFYQRAGTGMDDSKMNYVLNRYDENAALLTSKLFTFDYNNACQLLEVAKQDGEKDYVILSQTCKKYGPKGSITKEADYAEIILIDGKTLDVKFKEEIKLKFSKWYLKYAGYTPEGSIILMGPASESNTDYLPYPGSSCQVGVEDKAFKGYGVCNFPDESPNFQTIVIQNNKVESINGISKQEAQSLSTVLEGTPYKAKATPFFTATNVKVVNTGNQLERDNFIVNYVNNKIIVSLEPFIEKKGIEFEGNGWSTMILDSKGKLEKYFILPTEGYCASDQLFSADKKTMYWTCYEPNSLNDGKNGYYSPKTVKNMVAGQLMIATIDLTANTASKVQMIGEKEFAVNAKSALVADTDSEMIFQGRTLNKKAKDSELILIKVKK